MKKTKRKNKGITLIALVITIIVLLILAGVTIASLSGDNGILTKAIEAKKNMNEAEEEEQVSIAYSSELIKNKGENVTAQGLQNELDNQLKKGKTKVTGTTNLKIKFKDTGNIYIIKNNKIEKYIPEPVTEDIYVALYNDGTLVFSNNETDIDSSKVKTNYGSIKNMPEDQYNGKEYSWGKDKDKITKVDIINKIVPEDINYYFKGLNKVTNMNNLSNINTENITSLLYTFDQCSALTELDLSGWDVGNVTRINGLVGYCENLLRINISNWDTSSVTNMDYMFDSGYPTATLKIEKITGIEDLDTSNVTSMGSMFCNCRSLQELNLSKWDTSKVTVMSCMFANCIELLEINLSNWNTSKVIYMSNIFGRDSEYRGGKEAKLKRIIGIDKFNTSSVEYMDYMFNRCPDLIVDCSNWNIDKVKEHEGFNQNSPNVKAPIWKQ